MSENERFIWNNKTHYGYVIDTKTTKHLSYHSCMVKLNELNDENKELKQFKEQVFNLINKKLEENKKLNGVDTAMYYANKQTLNELKRELIK